MNPTDLQHNASNRVYVTLFREHAIEKKFSGTPSNRPTNSG